MLNVYFSHDLAITFLDIYPKEIKTCVYRKNLYMNIYRGFTCNRQNMEMSQLSFNRWMDKQSVLHSYNETLLHNKKEQTIDTCNHPGVSQGTYAKWKKPISRGYIL